MICPNEECDGFLILVDNISKIGTSYKCNRCENRWCVQHKTQMKLPNHKKLLKELKKTGLDPFLYHQASSSFYIKFELDGMKSLRVSDHPGRKKYTYKWNLRSDIDRSYEEIDRGVKRFYYHVSDLKKMIVHMIRYKYYVEQGGR